VQVAGAENRPRPSSDAVDVSSAGPRLIAPVSLRSQPQQSHPHSSARAGGGVIDIPAMHASNSDTQLADSQRDMDAAVGPDAVAMQRYLPQFLLHQGSDASLSADTSTAWSSAAR